MTLSAYIHIPFCTHKCEFCDFAAFAGMGHLESDYCDVVCKEICERATADPAEQKLTSLFYGGGTPGLISLENLTKIQSCLDGVIVRSADCEVNLETTPHAISVEKAQGWRNIGINRLSIGVESLQDSELKAIGRDHTRLQALQGINDALAAGFNNISIDLMYGLPTQSTESWTDTLTQLFELASQHEQIRHFSAYSLHLAANSPLYSMFPRNSLEYPDDLICEELFHILVKKASEAGFEHYEVSNFAKEGYQSRHNMSYWNNSEYLAFGVSAHRYRKGIRSSNWRSMGAYMKDYLGDETNEPIDVSIRMKEAIMLGLRLRAGIDLQAFEQEFGIDLSKKFRREIAKLLDGGFIECTDDRLKISTRGVMVSNSIIAEFF